MSLVVPPGFGLASIYLTDATGTPPFVTTIGLDLTPAGGNYIDAANNVLASYIDAFQGITSEDARIDRVLLYVGADGGSGSIESTDNGAFGIRDADMAPFAMALIARKVTSNLGRSGKGRMFVPCVLADADVNAGGNLESGSQTVFQTAINNFYNNLLTADPTMELQPVLLHSEGSPSTTPTPIQGLLAANQVGWIRKRIR